ncbi:hypothetical protein OEA41_001693 [Lepraria neglecta]|uniref:Uncharacterized protein n=1 Tax=Lepraria neglecta TaxID=209136 RepID=A0AAD9ZDM9_9LECA|nr:hypothetical protein OEA41_001693 [Lepraria neglecta]
MVQIAERAYLLDDQVDKIGLIENAHRQWDGQAIFEWQWDDRSVSEGARDSDSISGLNEPLEQSSSDDAMRNLEYAQENPLDQHSDGIQPSLFFPPIETVCFMCGGLLDAEGLCVPCLSQCSYVSSGEETKWPEICSERTTSGINLTSEVTLGQPHSNRDLWDFSSYQIYDNRAADTEQSRCHWCGAAAIFPGDDTCFPCFSGLKVGTGFDSSWNVPLPVPDYMSLKRLALESEEPSKVIRRGSMLEQKDHAKGLSNSRGGACQRCRVSHTKCVHKVQEGQSQLIHPRTSSHLELESVGLFGSTSPIRQPSEMSSGRESSADEQPSPVKF